MSLSSSNALRQYVAPMTPSFVPAPSPNSNSSSIRTPVSIRSPVETTRSDPESLHFPARALTSSDSDTSIHSSVSSSPSVYHQTSSSFNSVSPVPIDSSTCSSSSNFTQDQLDFYYTNATSLNNKLHLLEASTATFHPSIVAISETWFNENSIAAMNGYQLFRSDRRNNQTGGGVCIYVRDGIQAFEAPDTDLLSSDCEQVWVAVKSSKKTRF